MPYLDASGVGIMAVKVVKLPSSLEQITGAHCQAPTQHRHLKRQFPTGSILSKLLVWVEPSREITEIPLNMRRWYGY